MKVNSIDQNNTNFSGFYNSKGLTKILEFAADNSYLFAGTTSLVLSTCVRPALILATPKTDDKNKKYACSKSLSSSAIGYLLTLAVSLPFANSIKQINKTPEKYLTKETINNFKDGAKELSQSKAYELGTQMFKLGLGFIVAAPKAILTALGVPVIMDNLFKQKEQNNTPSKSIQFKGKHETLPNFISKILNNKNFQEFSKNYKETNFPMHIMAITDTIATGAFIAQTTKSKKIEKERKSPLIYNSIIATALSVASSYIIDKALDKKAEGFIEKLKVANKNSSDIEKYIKGARIVKPVLIMGSIYYIAIPIVSTFLADRIKPKA